LAERRTSGSIKGASGFCGFLATTPKVGLIMLWAE
jgi:hypothetical protein